MSSSQLSEGLRLLKRPDFLKLFIAYLVSYSGTAMAPIAMAFGVLELTGSTKDSAFVLAAPITAQIFIILLGGAFADRSSRQRILVGSDFVAAASQLAMAIAFLSGTATVPLLALFMLINGCAAAFNTPAAMGFIPQMVDGKDLQAANALFGLARNSAFTLGAAAAGVLVANFGAGVTLLIDAISFAISGLFIASLRPKQQVLPEAASIIQDIKLGWSEFISHTWLWTIVVQFSLVVAGFEAVIVLIGPAVAKAHMNGAADWGLISAGFGIGTLIGGLIAMRINVKRPMFFASFLVFFFALLPLALTVPLPVWMLVAIAIVHGTTGSIFGVLWSTTLHKMIAPDILSSFSAFDHLGSIVLAPLGIVIAGFLYEIIGGEQTLLIIVATIVLPTICVLGVKDVRRLTTEEVNKVHLARTENKP